MIGHDDHHHGFPSFTCAFVYSYDHFFESERVLDLISALLIYLRLIISLLMGLKLNRNSYKRAQLQSSGFYRM